MKYIFILLVSLSINNNLWSQKDYDFKNSGYAKKYNSFLNSDAELVFVNYYQSVEKIDSSYILKTYNPDKLVITSLTTYKDFQTTIKHGKYSEWLDDESIWKTGSYQNGKKHGYWEFYDFDSKTVESGNFNNGLETGVWHVKDSKGRITTQYRCESGNFEGEYIRFDTLGNKFHVKNYVSDKLINEVIIDTVTYLKNDNRVDQMPILKECSSLKNIDKKEECVNTKYLKYIYGNISYPKKAIKYNVEGKAIISFTIDKEGSLENIKVIRGICKEIEEECIRIIKNSPKWSPGAKNGKPIKVNFNQPINFRLE